MKKVLISLLVAAALVGGAIYSKSLNANNDILKMNVEALAVVETCPGEDENCEDGGERCTYWYKNRNYNIETKSNRR